MFKLFQKINAESNIVNQPNQSSYRRHGFVLSILVLVWFGMVAIGTGIVWQYEHDDGAIYSPPEQWPLESNIKSSKTQFTLLFFAHPRCPCTRASIGELARIMTVCKDQVRSYAIFVKPEKCESVSDWEKTDLWQSADRIPGVTTMSDDDGSESRRFLAATSGFVVLYDQKGQLKFHGGITASRGHSGDNAGRSSIISLLAQGKSPINMTKVYGCELGISFSGLEHPCCQQ